MCNAKDVGKSSIQTKPGYMNDAWNPYYGMRQSQVNQWFLQFLDNARLAIDLPRRLNNAGQEKPTMPTKESI